jgi:hypothetical protein
VDFTAFVLSQLPPPPARLLEVGCGEEGGIVDALAEAGYEVLGIDPDAPEGPRFRRIALEQLEEPARYDAVVASRVLHHVHPLGPALDKLARLAPLLLVDEFAWERIDAPTQQWYEAQYRMVSAAAGVPRRAPASLDEWRAHHWDLHPSSVLLAELGARFEERHLEQRPYFYRWLGDPATEEVERGLIAAGAIQPIGVRYAGVATTETVRSSAASR